MGYFGGKRFSLNESEKIKRILNHKVGSVISEQPNKKPTIDKNIESNNTIKENTDMRIKKNGKIFTLTESDLKRITKKVLREQEETQLKDGNFEVTNPDTNQRTSVRVKGAEFDSKDKPGEKYVAYGFYINNEPMGRMSATGNVTPQTWDKLLRATGGKDPENYPKGNPKVVSALKSGIKGITGIDPKV